MKRQTDLQRAIAEAAAQPYVWADVRLSTANGWTLHLVVGNSGATVATDVKVAVDPPFPSAFDRSGHVDGVQRKLAAGLSSLGPGHEWHWALGASKDLVNQEVSMAHVVTIRCNGPAGEVPLSQYVIDMADFREAVAQHEGTLHQVTKAIEKLTTVQKDRSP